MFQQLKHAITILLTVKTRLSHTSFASSNREFCKLSKLRIPNFSPSFVLRSVLSINSKLSQTPCSSVTENFSTTVNITEFNMTIAYNIYIYEQCVHCRSSASVETYSQTRIYQFKLATILDNLANNDTAIFKHLNTYSVSVIGLAFPFFFSLFSFFKNSSYQVTI